MFKGLFSKKEEIRSIGSGILKELEAVPDQMFAEKMLGDGFAIDLKDNEIVAPISGELVSVFPTGHAYGIQNDKMEVLVHLGIDTVQLDGEGFEIKVKQGDRVKQGDLLAIMDLDLIQSKGFVTMSPVVITSGQKLEILKSDEIISPDTEDIVKLK